MFPLKKGKTTQQAHVGLPEGTFEEEHGRKGFYGKAAHLYHANPPTGWTRFEGKLRPHLFDLNKMQPTDMHDADGEPATFLGNNDVQLSSRGAPSRCRFIFATVTVTSCISSIAARAPLRPISAPWRIEKGDYIVLPRSVTYRVVPSVEDNFFLIIQSKAEFDQPDRGLLGQHALYDPAVIVTPERRTSP